MTSELKPQCLHLQVSFFNEHLSSHCILPINNYMEGSLSFELIQAFIVVLVEYKNEEDPLENKGARVVTKYLLL